MKIVIFIVLLSVTSYVKCDIDDSKLIHNLLLQYMKNYVISNVENICTEKTDQLKEVPSKVRQCVNNIDIFSKSACLSLEKDFLNCSKPLIGLAEQCLSVESKEIPTLMFKSILAFAKFLCNTEGKDVLSMVSCLLKSNKNAKECSEKLKQKLQQYKKSPPTKSDVCEFATSFKPCMENNLLKECGSGTNKKTALGLFDALTTPCNESN